MIPKLLISAAMMAANMALTMTRKIEGPRLDDLKFTSGDYGAPLTMLWGMRRLQVPIFWAEDLREVKRQRKTKGGKFNEYTYYGTWAVAVAGHEIDAVRRIWFDTHLVLDLTGAGPITPFELGYAGNGGKGGPLSILGGVVGVVVGNQGAIAAEGYILGDHFVLYKGTETQAPDPRMQATIEAAHGEGSCPAYRGVAHIVFKDFPLEKLGNRIPQVTVEAVRNPAALHPTSTLAHGLGTQLFQFAPDFATIAVRAGDQLAVIDTAARAEMLRSTLDPFPEDSSGLTAYLGGDGVIATGEVANQPVLYNLSGAGTVISTSTVGAVVDVIPGRGADGVTHWGARLLFAYDKGYYDGIEFDLSDVTGTEWAGRDLCGALDGSMWFVGGISGYFCAYRVDGGPVISRKVAMPSGSFGGAICYQGGGLDQFVVWWGSNIYAIDVATGTITASAVAPAYAPDYFNTAVGAPTAWCGFTEVSLADLSVVRTLNLEDWIGGGATDAPTAYDPVNHALVIAASGSLTWCYLDRIGAGSVTLGEIIGDLADHCGVSSYDFSALDQTVQGWSATQGQATNMAEPLLDAFDSDVRPHEFTMQGIKRTGTSGGTLTTAWFVADSPRYAIKVRQASDLPRALTYSFADVDADQQPANVRADRPLDATDAKAERQIDLSTLASDADEARGLAERHFRRLWNERREVSLSLTAKELALEPGDCRVLDLDGETDTYRCVSVTVKANDTLATEWKYDHPSLAGLSGATGATFDGHNESTVVVALLSKGFILDIPYLADADDDARPLLYMGAAPYAAGAWSGATIYEAIDGEYSLEAASVASSSPATWGYANAALPDGNPNLWDRGSSLNVTLQYGTLTGTTEAAIDADPSHNLMLIGNELVNFTTATLEGDGTYTLSGFKRGRRGTEWACATHAARDVVLLVDTMQDVAQGLSEVGTAMSFKAITAGRSTAFPEDIASFSGASLKPYAPCHLAGVKNAGTGDWALSWVRRTRIGGAWTSGTSIPLSETAEAYEVDIMDGATVKRTITGLTSPAATYADSAQVTDFGTTQASVTFRVYQISAAVDRGFVAQATA